MDNVTHALAGSLLAAATCQLAERHDAEPSPTFRHAAWTLGVVMAELPDADLVYSGESLGMGKLGYLLHHRGHTHTVLFAIASAIVVWGLVLLLRRTLRTAPLARPLLALSIVASLSHLVLDYTNSYGVHPLWPFDKRWFYGDAVFIVEPWLWIVSLPFLFLIVRRVAPRVLFGALLIVILVASWRVDMVSPGVAAVLTTGAALAIVVARAATPSARVGIALTAWLAVEAMFFASSGVARRLVRRDVGAPYRDAVLSPAPGNPLCFSALVVTEEGGTYAATRATVAPFPSVRPAATCRPPESGDDVAPGRRDTPAIRWGERWSAPVAELRALTASHCEVAAALGFMRVPAWREEANGDVSIGDLRFGAESGGFTSIVARRGAPCPHPVPDWEWPRRDLFPARP